jgi:hypothetical protein
MSRISLPQNFKVVTGISPVTDTAARTADYVCLKNCRRAWAVIEITGGAATAVALDSYQASAADASDETVLVNTQRWWMNADVSATDTLVAQTAAISYDTAATATNKIVVVEFDPVQLTSGLDWITIKTGGDSASNLVSLTWILDTDFMQATPPTAIA